MDISISPAQRSDISILAAINQEAYMYETIPQLAYTTWPDMDDTLFYEGRLAGRWDRRGCHIFKVTDRATGEIQGFVCWTLEEISDGSKPKMQTPSAKMLAKASGGRNMEFVMAVGEIMETLTEHMEREKHYYLSTLAVRRKAQNQGIGSLLLKHCLALADEDGMVSWLMAFPRSHDLYVRHGYKDIDHRDVDLSKYDKYKYRGYGVYRSYAMRRDPVMPTLTSDSGETTQKVG